MRVYGPAVACRPLLQRLLSLIPENGRVSIDLEPSPAPAQPKRRWPWIVGWSVFGLVVIAVGIVSAALSGFAAVWFLLAYLRRHDFTPFVVYRLAVGVGALILIATGVRSALGI